VIRAAGAEAAASRLLDRFFVFFRTYFGESQP
jgi:hypothetical protein